MASRVIPFQKTPTQRPMMTHAVSGRWIPRSVREARVQVHRIIEEAQREAAILRHAAQQAYSEQVRRGYQKGFQSGWRVWQAAVDEIRQTWTSLVEATRPQVARLALQIAQRLLKHHFTLHPDAILPLVEEGLATLVNHTTVQVSMRISPILQPFVERCLPAWQARFSSLGEIRLIVDESLNADEVHMETRLGGVDVSLETALRRIERQWFQETSPSNTAALEESP